VTVYPSEQVIRASWTDADRLSHVIAAAFHRLAPSQWLVPDPAARWDLFPAYFRIYVDDALANGLVYTNADRTAAALWFHKGAAWNEQPSDHDARLAAATGPWVGRFRAFDALLDEAHPDGVRHDHLAILAVHPDRWRRGIGVALLESYHRLLDREDVAIPAYLEAADAELRELYGRHGYEDVGGPIQLPDRGPSMYPMWRRSRARAAPPPWLRATG
jgi:GNAT superfamily N-acetyltransferase